MSRDVRDQFGRQAAFYAASRTHSSSDSLRVLLELAAGQSGETALDVATGTGFTACGLAPSVGLVYATDITPEMLQETQKLAQRRGLANVRFALAAAENLPFGTVFDIVACRLAPHHFNGVQQAIAEMTRAIKPGGRLLLCDTAAPEDAVIAAWMNDVERRRDPTHRRNLAPSEWVGGLQAAGLHVTHQVMTKTHHEFREWARLSATPAAAAAALEQEFRDAPPEIAAALSIKIEGEAITFAWDCPVFRAEKPA